MIHYDFSHLWKIESLASAIPFKTFTLSSSEQNSAQSLRLSSGSFTAKKSSLNLPWTPLALLCLSSQLMGLRKATAPRISVHPVILQEKDLWLCPSLTGLGTSWRQKLRLFPFRNPSGLDNWSIYHVSACNKHSRMLIESDKVRLYRGTISFNNLCV